MRFRSSTRLSSACFGLLAVLATSPLVTRAQDQTFAWDSITPTKSLVYHDCYSQDFQCARLILPLDWKNPQDARTVSVAITKLKAAVPDDDAAFGGSIFTNPGGPGISGVEFVVAAGPNIRSLVDKPGKRHYEIISFDPRGIANSVPIADCWPGDPLARDVSDHTHRINDYSINMQTLEYGIALAHSVNGQCQSVDTGNATILAYMDTASVARDMVAMLDKVEELRNPTKKTCNSDSCVNRLQYYGLSYGTLLGNYFASMFPGRVGKVVLDGVIDANDYTAYMGGLKNLVDADKIVDKFFEGCYAAGQEKCNIVRTTDKSARQLQRRITSWVDGLARNPIRTTYNDGVPLIITANDMRAVIGLAMYYPLQDFPAVAYALDNAMRGNLTELIGRMLSNGQLSPTREACSTDSLAFKAESQNAIVCPDGIDVSNVSAPKWKAYIDKQVRTSYWLGVHWSALKFACSGWTTRSNWAFRGPFQTPKPSKKAASPEAGRPAAPLLFLTNRLDPVAPISSARKMAAGHPGAGVVVQEALGHTTALAAQSLCMQKVVSDYYDTGVINFKETTCTTEGGPWDDVSS